jgi:lia operon protein LiaG
MGKTPLGRFVIVTVLISAGALCIALVIGIAAGGFHPWEPGRAGQSVDERASIPLDGVLIVGISGVSDNLRILEGSGSTAEVWLHGTIGTSSPDVFPHIQIGRSGNRADVGTRQKSPVGFGFFWSTVTLEVSVPRGYAGQVMAQTISGDIDVADHDFSDLQVSSTSGSIRAGVLHATHISMHSVSGGLSAKGITATQVELSTTSGSIRVAALQADVTARSRSGDVTLIFASAPGRVEAGSTSGGVTLKLPSGAGFVLDARSTSGDVSCGFPITLAATGTQRARHVMQGTVGSGAGNIIAHTTSGDVRIER